jgi:hypothetical protein
MEKIMLKTRDFTDATKNKLLQTIRQGDSQQEGIWWIWNDLADVVSDIFIDDDISHYGSEIERYHREILDKKNTTVSQLDKIWDSVYEADDMCRSSLEKNREDVRLMGQKYKQLLDALDPCNSTDGRPPLWGMSDEEANSFCADVLRGLDVLQKKQSPYDKYGRYGGMQHGPLQTPDRYDAIIEKYYPGLSVSQLWTIFPPTRTIWAENGGQVSVIDLFLNPEKYHSRRYEIFLMGIHYEGCEYVALVNTVFLQYIGREYEFEATFGFPLYVDGDFNYNALIVDFYASSGTADGSGLNAWKSEGIWEKYLADRGVEVDVTPSIKVTPQNFAEVSEKGEIFVEVFPVLLFNEDGGEEDNRKGGHAMVITGVTSEGYFIVSSWGKTYYVHPDDPRYIFINYAQVEYK